MTLAYFFITRKIFQGEKFFSSRKKKRRKIPFRSFLCLPSHDWRWSFILWWEKYFSSLLREFYLMYAFQNVHIDTHMSRVRHNELESGSIIREIAAIKQTPKCVKCADGIASKMLCGAHSVVFVLTKMLNKVLNKTRILWKLNQFCIHQQQHESVFFPTAITLNRQRTQTLALVACYAFSYCVVLPESTCISNITRSSILLLSFMHWWAEFNKRNFINNENLFPLLHSPPIVERDSLAFVCKFILKITRQWTHIESLFELTHSAFTVLWCCGGASDEQKNNNQ